MRIADSYYVVEALPLDHWDGTISVIDRIKESIEGVPSHKEADINGNYPSISSKDAPYVFSEIGRISNFVTWAQRQIKERTDWEGDIIQDGLFFTPSQEGIEMEVGYILKQGNNGTTYYVIPIDSKESSTAVLYPKS